VVRSSGRAAILGSFDRKSKCKGARSPAQTAEPAKANWPRGGTVGTRITKLPGPQAGEVSGGSDDAENHYALYIGRWEAGERGKPEREEKPRIMAGSTQNRHALGLGKQRTEVIPTLANPPQHQNTRLRDVQLGG